MHRWRSTSRNSPARCIELLSAPISSTEAVFAYIGAAATKSVFIGLIILATATLFVPVRIMHPGWMIAFLVLTAVSFGLFGFLIGIWAETFEQLAIIPSLVVTPLTFLGGAFYSIDMLPQPWRTVSLFNPVVYLVSGFRWSFYGVGDVARRDEPRLRRGFHGAVPGVAVVDLPHGLPSEAVKVDVSPRVGRSAVRLYGGSPAGDRKLSTNAAWTSPVNSWLIG